MNEKELVKNLGELLREVRKEKGFTLVEVGEKTGFSQPYLSELEKGRKDKLPPLKTIEKIFSVMFPTPFYSDFCKIHDKNGGIIDKYDYLEFFSGFVGETVLTLEGFKRLFIFFQSYPANTLMSAMDSRFFLLKIMGCNEEDFSEIYESDFLASKALDAGNSLLASKYISEMNEKINELAERQIKKINEINAYKKPREWVEQSNRELYGKIALILKFGIYSPEELCERVDELFSNDLKNIARNQLKDGVNRRKISQERKEGLMEFIDSMEDPENTQGFM